MSVGVCPVLVGHVAAGMIAKRIEPKVSLGTFVLAAMLADLLWCIFMLAGVEHVHYGVGMGTANYVTDSNTPFSHGLLTNMLWAGLFAVAFFVKRHYWRGTLLILAVVLSHWILDFISNREMPLVPGMSKVFGLDLWASTPLTLVVEGGLWLVGIIVYLRQTPASSRIGVYGFWFVAALITLVWYNNIAGPPPPNPNSAPIFALILFSLIVAWAYWMNRARSLLASDR
ncbi:MAG: hypothetical protein ACM3JB_05095 [Acidobacteriaceae bacterium]